MNIVYACLSQRRLPIGPAALSPFLAFFLFFAAMSGAHAVVQGRTSSLGSQTVRIGGRGGDFCTGVVISRTLIATAAHCAGRNITVEGGSVATAGSTRSAVLDDGRRVSAAGDAVILKLRAPLPGSMSAIPVGPGSGSSYTIAGYGAIDEKLRGSFGGLHEASLVSASRFALVDPNRSGAISASACFGDSGGPVMRGSELVGIISRAAHPSPRIACGYLTRWSPIYVSGAPRETNAVASRDGVALTAAIDFPRRKRPRH